MKRSTVKMLHRLSRALLVARRQRDRAMRELSDARVEISLARQTLHAAGFTLTAGGGWTQR